MLNARRAALLGILIAIVAATPGCLVRRRVITRQSTPSGKPKPLISATRDDLVRRLVVQFNVIKAFNATVDMTPATGSVYKGEITEYKDIRAYVLYRRPNHIRVIGLAPVVRTKMFDMVSTGETFQIFISPKNRFIEGRNDAAPTSKNSLENLRPETFLRAMLVSPPDPAETPLLIDATDEESSLYALILIKKTAKGDLLISRIINFDRTSLNVVRQEEYDEEGNIQSDTRYKDWKTYSHVLFPGTIDINRPKDGYGVSMTVVKLDMNGNLGDDKFVLAKPEGAQLQTIGDSAAPKEPNP